jgi:hypothetical protein
MLNMTPPNPGIAVSCRVLKNGHPATAFKPGSAAADALTVV